jgi:hypothetical protein
MKIPEIIDNLNSTEYSMELRAKCNILLVINEIAQEPGMNLPRLQGAINEAFEHSQKLLNEKID